MLTVVGTSSATLSTASGVCAILFPIESHTLTFPKIFNVLYSNGTCPLNNGAGWYGQATPLSRRPWIRPWYGFNLRCRIVSNILTGTSLICAFLEIFMFLVSLKVLRRIFPPMVTGTVILIIGAALVGESGIPNWGGGPGDCRSRPETGFFQLCPNIAAPKPKLYVCIYTQSNLPLTVLEVGIPRVHRSRIRLLRVDHLDRYFWIPIPQEHQYHRRIGRGMYRCRCYRLHR